MQGALQVTELHVDWFLWLLGAGTVAAITFWENRQYWSHLLQSTFIHWESDHQLIQWNSFPPCVVIFIYFYLVQEEESSLYTVFKCCLLLCFIGLYFLLLCSFGLCFFTPLFLWFMFNPTPSHFLVCFCFFVKCLEWASSFLLVCSVCGNTCVLLFHLF